MRPGFSCTIDAVRSASDRANHAVRAAIYEVQGLGVKLTGIKLSHQTERRRSGQVGCCLRALGAWDFSALIRSGRGPRPSVGAPAVAALGVLFAFAGISGSAASMAWIGEFGPSSWIASFASSAAM